jgi:hypothetical protein
LREDGLWIFVTVPHEIQYTAPLRMVNYLFNFILVIVFIMF